MNKELQDTNKKLQIKCTEQDKKINETSGRFSKLREDLTSADKMLQERGDQINKALQRIKLQDAQIADLEKERRNKDGMIARYQKNISGATADSSKSQFQKLETELKEALKLIDIKDHEIKILKDLVKSYQHQFKQKEQEVYRLRRGVKLTPLTREIISPLVPSTRTSNKAQTERKNIKLHENTALTGRNLDAVDNKIHLQPIDGFKRETSTPDPFMKNRVNNANEIDLSPDNVYRGYSEDKAELPEMDFSTIEYPSGLVSRDLPDTELLLAQLQEAEQYEQDQEAKINELNEELYDQIIPFDAPVQPANINELNGGLYDQALPSDAQVHPEGLSSPIDDDFSAEVTFDKDT